MDIVKHIQELRSKGQKAEKLEKLIGRLPDLEIQTNRWNHNRICSGFVNSIADQVDIHYSCGCCPDSNLIAEPYVIFDGLKIYGKPFSVCVGQKKYRGFGDIPVSDWRIRLTSAGYSDKIVEAVQNHFDKNPPENYDD